jgi:DNA-directed RNA polymerase subunit RPC12/RpoP
MWLLLATAGIMGATGFGAFVALAVSGRPHVCPKCEHKTLRLVATRSTFVTGEAASLERMYRCGECKAELMRRGKGAMIPRESWDRGERAELPAARLLDR